MIELNRVLRCNRRVGGLLLMTMIVGTGGAWAAKPGSPDKAQIEAGVALYKERCVMCHSENLTGGAGPPLRGKDFLADWQGKPLRALYSRILMTMPANDPGSLEPDEVLTLVSYLATENALVQWSGSLKSADELSTLIVSVPK